MLIWMWDYDALFAQCRPKCVTQGGRESKRVALRHPPLEFDSLSGFVRSLSRRKALTNQRVVFQLSNTSLPNRH